VEKLEEKLRFCSGSEQKQLKEQKQLEKQ